MLVKIIHISNRDYYVDPVYLSNPFYFRLLSFKDSSPIIDFLMDDMVYNLISDIQINVKQISDYYIIILNLFHYVISHFRR